MVAERGGDETRLTLPTDAGPRVHEHGARLADDEADRATESVRPAAELTLGGLPDVEQQVDEVGGLAGRPAWSARTGPPSPTVPVSVSDNNER